MESSDIAPRLRKLRDEIESFQSQITTLKVQKSISGSPKQINRRDLNRYVADLHALLAEGSYFERRSFLKSFITSIRVDFPQVSMEYKLPLTKEPPYNSEVLSIAKLSGVDETRTRGLMRDRHAF